MLSGQMIEVFTDHTNLIQDSCRFTLHHVYQWTLLFVEYSPKLEQMKEIQNSVANAISQLDINTLNQDKVNWMRFTKHW